MQKEIHIIGGPGAGKTRAGAALSERFGLAHLDLDEVFWNRDAKTFGTSAYPRVRDDALAEFIALSPRIVEGAYVGNCLIPNFAATDSIIAMRPWVFVRDWGYSTRRLKRKLGISPRKQHKRETLKGLWDLCKYNRNV